ncbi:hemicentin-1-like [Schistocerca piceifrons]|uniref:hemicentin-1-like n=1 Tax=Schistocerca piceifrons TaxID=274613 RepID=UPI001F5ED047|nr:hemicentin-1-like [Schistocerca piceifrons]
MWTNCKLRPSGEGSATDQTGPRVRCRLRGAQVRVLGEACPANRITARRACDTTAHGGAKHAPLTAGRLHAVVECDAVNTACVDPVATAGVGHVQYWYRHCLLQRGLYDALRRARFDTRIEQPPAAVRARTAINSGALATMSAGEQVPPDNVSILDEHGRVVKEVLGPYPEGAQPTVSCVATGGRPIPRLYWRLNGAPPLEGALEQQRLLPEGGVAASLRLPRLSRALLLAVVSCQAVSSPHVPPVAASAAVHLLLEPLTVRLLDENRPLSAGRQYELRCETAGSRPAATVTWWKDGEQLPHDRELTNADGNVTTSVAQVTPALEDAGRQLCCHAANARVQGGAVSDCWTLHVRYSPVVSLELGSNINGSAIREGVDVYFECNVRADPWIHKVIWRHNGRLLHNNVSAGTLLSNQTLVLQAVTRNSSGLYTCVASNSEGDTESNAFNLDVKFAPECRPGQQLVWGAARREVLQVPCEVEARPPARLFRWAFNSSAAASETRPLDAGVTAAAPGRSVLQYQPMGERDYGTLLCWGRNELGAQAVPCVFHIVPAGRPDAPHSCEVSGRGATTLRVTCARGSDGGLPQQFTLELADAERRLVANVTSRGRPDFLLEGLQPGARYTALVYSSNGKGRSQGSAAR